MFHTSMPMAIMNMMMQPKRNMDAAMPSRILNKIHRAAMTMTMIIMVKGSGIVFLLSYAFDSSDDSTAQVEDAQTMILPEHDCAIFTIRGDE